MTLQGGDNASLTLQNTTLNATSGNVSLSANVADGNALVVTGGSITAGQDITLNGTATGGSGTGVSLTGMNMTATGNISVSGKGFDSSGGALSVTGNNTFSAQNTVLSGDAGRNNVGTLLSGKLNVTQGNLSVTGTMNKYSADVKNEFRGLKMNGLALDVSNGNLTLTGKAVEYPDAGPQGGGTVGLELSGSCLKANHADLSGLNVDSGSGFTLNNVTLSGGIAQGNNMTFSSQGSDVNVTNTLNVNGGLGYGAFEVIRGAGIDNNTSVGALTASQNDMQKYLNFSGATSDWVFDVGSQNLNSSTGNKAGVWSVAGFTGINATTTGNISLTGMSLTDSNLTGSSVTLQGEDNASLTLQNTTLNATSGNVSLSANGSISLSAGSVQALQGSVNVLAGGVNGTGGGNALTVSNVSFSSQNGTTLSGLSAQNGTGVKLNGAIHVTLGNLAVNGSTTRVDNGIEVRGIDARGANINVSGTNAVLNMTGAVKGDTGATLSPSVVGLDLGGNSVLNATSANLTGVSTAKGEGFILNTSLSGSLKDTNGNNLTLSSQGSGNDVHNYIGNRVDDRFVKHLIDANTSVGSKTEVQKADIYKTELEKFISDNQNQNDLTKDFGEWILSFTGIDVSKAGNISFTGASFSNSNLTAGGNLMLDNGPGNLSLGGSNLTATNGYVNLTGGSGINLANGNISANTDITINASNGGVTISGKNNSSGMACVTSTSGNISIYGNATERAQSGVSLTNAHLSAEKGSINVKGDTDAAGDPYKYTSKGGVSLSGTVNFSSTSNTVYGHNSHSLNAATGGFVVNNDGAYTFSGNTSINGVGEQGYGVVFYVTSSTATFNFKSGEYYSFDGSGVVGTYAPPYAYGAKQIKFNVEEGTLNFSGKGTNGSGISGNDFSTFNTGYLFSGNGNVNIKGSSESGAGVDSRYLNNTGLTGCFTVTGESQSGTGVVIVYNTDWNVQNATITGTSATGTGINISGNKLYITNVTLNGTSGGSGAGVQLTGGTNYTVDGATVSGQSQAGNGVSVGGNLSVSNGTVSGMTATGSGVDIGGDLNTVNTTITGNASGNGSGVSLNGNVTGDLTEKNMITGHSGQGNGVLVSGNSTATNVTLNGDTVDGNGIKVTGNLMTDNVVASGNATGNGSGISLAGNVTGGHWTGNSSPGTGVSVSEDSTLSDVTLSGTTATGTGVNVAGNLTNAGNT
ncbi:hypothetical protein CB225_24260, partial [Salmonella enterica subsp. enterica serovar Newport]|nr:hypothetical protein [Salmonella enterica subsp. enterica serovar Newport]